ncbi:MAG: flagellar hook-basal body protein [Synergistaceae bacterium]|nr:flagellar hook-basal body protein [Synergistaceae bacterium]MBQ4402333.1 flagellar hook-basal body protein [Synergistaceae bacterium]MBQ6114608.1 flagellar hook-basal body protein [Synergistaceae bacterium]MBQ6664812.1 flagellar hook-basal body protein [Synergistaceae bacterium]MBQ6980894.1 flagellar hook-basal body protein [Synergistaceae bacterium]
MHRGIYEAASGMLVQETHLDVITNNLANVDTPGYKRRISATADFSALLDRIEKVSEDGETKITTVLPADMPFKGREVIGSVALAAIFSEDVMDTFPGVVKTSENPLDIAIDGPGFFSLSDEEGNTYYTRAGNFTLDNNGNIVNPNGLMLQGEGGNLSVGNNAEAVEVNKAGQVIVKREGLEQEVIGRVAVFNFERPTYLRHMANNLLVPTEQSGEAENVENPKIWSGMLEASNVEVVTEMARMIEAQRIYEGASKALMTHDEQTSKLITSFSRG